MGQERFRTQLENGSTYLQDERELRGFDPKKGWIQVTAHTADLLAELAESRYVSKQDQARFWRRSRSGWPPRTKSSATASKTTLPALRWPLSSGLILTASDGVLGLRSWTRATRLFLNRVRRQCRRSGDSKTIRISCVLRSHGSL